MQSGDTIYLVTAGDYSDYYVVAVCSTRASAEAVIQRYNGPEARWPEATIEEYVLDRPWKAPEGCWVAAGAGNNAWWEADAKVHDKDRKDIPWDGRYGARIRWHGSGSYQIHAFGRTKEHAMRAYREMDRAIKAGTVIPSADFDLLPVEEQGEAP